MKAIYKSAAIASVLVLSACSNDDSLIPQISQAYFPNSVSLVIPDDLQQYIYVDGTGSNVLPMLKGSNAQLDVKVGPDSCTTKEVNWSSSTPSVATVSEDGYLEAISGDGVGYSTIKVIPVAMAEGAGIMDKIKVKVANELIPATSIKIAGEKNEIYVGDQLALTDTILPEEATYQTLKWTSSDESIATVDMKGVVTGVGVKANETESAVTITGTALDGSGVNASYNMFVQIPVNPEEVKFNLPENTFAITEKSVALQYTTVPAKSTASLIKWSSSDESIATVDNGVVTFNQTGKFGTFTITAECPNGNKYDVALNLPAGLLRETFSNKNSYTWTATTNGASQWVADGTTGGHLEVTTQKGSYHIQNIKCTEAATYLCTKNYPILAIRMTDVQDLDSIYSRNITWDEKGKNMTTSQAYSGAIGGGANKWTKDIVCKDGSHVFLYDLTQLYFGTTQTASAMLPANGEIGMFTTFQIKYADIKNQQKANITGPVTYKVYWIQSFKSSNDCSKYLKNQGLIDK